MTKTHSVNVKVDLQGYLKEANIWRINLPWLSCLHDELL